MCRLAAFPPGFKREKAIEILLEFEACNTDGTGYTYIQDGKFVTHKWPRSLTSLLKRNKDILPHMPHNGWTIAHLRAASHGANTPENTHPFEIDNKWAICHNGIWSDYDIAKLALKKYVSFAGETDSEVAAHLINNLGPKNFAKEIKHGGVYLALNLDGSLWVMITSGELVLNNLKNDTILIASELDQEKFPSQADALEGWYHFGSNGKYIAHKANPDWHASVSGYGGSAIHITDFRTPGCSVKSYGGGVSSFDYRD